MGDWADEKARELYNCGGTVKTLAAALREAHRAGLEEAAEACDDIHEHHRYKGDQDVAKYCARAIRACIEGKP